MNEKNVLRLAAHLREIGPERFNMNTWCGSACCIGGHAALLAKEDGDLTGSHYSAQRWLGLTDHESDTLFYPMANEDWFASNERAAGILENLVKTGRVDWSSA